MARNFKVGHRLGHCFSVFTNLESLHRPDRREGGLARCSGPNHAFARFSVGQERGPQVVCAFDEYTSLAHKGALSSPDSIAISSRHSVLEVSKGDAGYRYRLAGLGRRSLQACSCVAVTTGLSRVFLVDRWETEPPARAPRLLSAVICERVADG